MDQVKHINIVKTTHDTQFHNPKRGPEPQDYTFVHDTVPDSSLPFIPEAEVVARRRITSGAPTSSELSAQQLWVVVDDIVYDCTSFVAEHPGGPEVIMSFVGWDSSWQFWRFHGKRQMREFGRALRIGQTRNVRNKFKESPLYVGSRRFSGSTR